MSTLHGGEILLDASTMEPPEPLQRASLILQNLNAGQYLRMLHRRLPYPLFDTCNALAIEHRHFPGRHSDWVILFWRRDDSPTAKYCQELES